MCLRKVVVATTRINTCEQVSCLFRTTTCRCCRRVCAGDRFRMYIDRRVAYMCTASEPNPLCVMNSPSSRNVMPNISSAAEHWTPFKQIVVPDRTSGNVSH